MSDHDDPTRWSHSTGELQAKRKTEVGHGDSAHSSGSYSGVEEAGSVLVSARAADLALLLSSSDKAK